ncbi:hypothetical protein [Tahibacter amnicola]|uniref:P/Homo B domain-containing protein n=1 Tax=Tahibacter amnicola TaxID=2976241 RepID=A0ABY6BPT4_9GAMM|nr:hypothetical protein [Tahibacter amnicola]UXI70571.1 hypothetical protein N4264_13295 [Tahibacter amnicola]
MKRISLAVALMVFGAGGATQAQPGTMAMDDPSTPPLVSAEVTSLLDVGADPEVAPAADAFCPLENAQAMTTRFCNATPLLFPAGGPASTYPSDVVVSGLEGVVTDVQLVLRNVSHNNTSQLAMRLEPPNGQVIGILGSGFDTETPPVPAVTNATLTFADSAQIYAVADYDGGNLAWTAPTGTNVYLPRAFAPPALPAPAPTTTVRQMLSSLEGTNGNGTWRLWASQNVASEPQPSGSVAGGWCLDVTTAPASNSCYYTATRVGSINAGDITQQGRITRSGRPSLCTHAKPSAALENANAVRYDRHDFPAISSQPVCLTVTADFTGCTGNQMQLTLYKTYSSATPNTGYLADSGFSTIGTMAFSTRLNANQGFTAVVSEVDFNTGCPMYSLRFETNTCQLPPAGDVIFRNGFQGLGIGTTAD